VQRADFQAYFSALGSGGGVQMSVVLIVVLVFAVVSVATLVLALGMGRAGAASDRQVDDVLLEHQRSLRSARVPRDEHVA